MSLAKLPTTLGIDFGTKRVGIARSYGTLAEPLEIVANDDRLMSKIEMLVRFHKIVQIVVGVSEAEMAEKSRAFGAALQKQLHIPVHFQDETLTTVRVYEALKERNGRVGKGDVDHFAAAVLLQDYLDEHLNVSD